MGSPRLAEFMSEADSAAIIRSEPVRLVSTNRAMRIYIPAATAADDVATQSCGPSTWNTSLLESVLNSNAGEATKNATRDKTGWAFSPRTPVLPAPYPTAMISQMMKKPDSTCSNVTFLRSIHTALASRFPR